ncbi:hypothetical protein AYI69_g11158 [Smittium culicis]|uniref:Uncharacterized protein n=1 Tax=Smittium culicis TaxID=133412 RepID=A0A1R1X0R2_9FUNG|nr:hypothetical protein AYI69_g11158 [Smittium culicis]
MLVKIAPELSFNVKSVLNNGIPFVDALSEVMRLKTKSKITGNDQLSFILPEKKDRCSIQLVLGDCNEDLPKLNMIKWVMVNSNTLYKNVHHCNKILVFCSPEIIPQSHFEKFENMEYSEYLSLSDEFSKGNSSNNVYHPLPVIFTDLSKDFYNITVFENPVYTNYMYIKVLGSKIMDPSSKHIKKTPEFILFSNYNGTSRLPEIRFGGYAK